MVGICRVGVVRAFDLTSEYVLPNQTNFTSPHHYRVTTLKTLHDKHPRRSPTIKFPTIEQIKNLSIWHITWLGYVASDWVELLIYVCEYSIPEPNQLHVKPMLIPATQPPQSTFQQ